MTLSDKITQRDIHKCKNLDLFKGLEERTSMYAPPMPRACEGLGWVRNRSPLCWLHPPSATTNTDPHLPLSGQGDWEKGGGGGGGEEAS